MFDVGVNISVGPVVGSGRSGGGAAGVNTEEVVDSGVVVKVGLVDVDER
jgi:hypothetical protein